MLRTMQLASLLIRAAASGHASDTSEKLIETNGYLLVHARVNGRGPFLFLLDTGATSSSVTPAVARAAGLVPRSRVTVATAAGEVVAAAVQAEVRVGGVTAVGTEALILPLDQPRRIDARIEGVLGQSFLSRFPCLIDYRGRRLWLGEEAARRAEALPERITAERVEGRLALPVQVVAGASPARLVLDSAAPALVLACGRQCPNLAARTEGGLKTNAGARKIVQGTLAAVSVGGIRFPRPAAVLLEGRPVTTEEDGLLPARWFSAVYMGPGNLVGLAR
jgi:hypothetical protein